MPSSNKPTMSQSKCTFDCHNMLTKECKWHVVAHTENERATKNQTKSEDSQLDSLIIHWHTQIHVFIQNMCMLHIEKNVWFEAHLICILSECHKSYGAHKVTTPSTATGEISVAFVMQMMAKRLQYVPPIPYITIPQFHCFIVSWVEGEEICIISIETTTHWKLSHLTHNSARRDEARWGETGKSFS